MEYGMLATIGLAVAAQVGLMPIIALRMAEHGRPRAAAMLALGSLNALAVVILRGPEWVAMMLTA